MESLAMPSRCGSPSLIFRVLIFSSGVERVAGLSAEQQLDEVRQKLMDLNPGFNGRLNDYGDASKPATRRAGASWRILDLDTNCVADRSVAASRAADSGGCRCQGRTGFGRTPAISLLYKA